MDGFLDYRPPRLAPDESLRRAREWRAELAGRRSVRFFSPDPLPDGILDELIATAGSAPSGANQQPWSFAVVTDPALKREIRAAAEEEERAFYEQRAPGEWLADLAALGTDWRKEFLETAPALIVIFRHSHGRYADGRVRKFYYTQESAGIAAGFLIAAIHHAGLATLTHTPSPMAFLERILKRPPEQKAFLLLPVGYPAADAVVPDIARKPLAAIRDVFG